MMCHGLSVKLHAQIFNHSMTVFDEEQGYFL